MIKVIVDKRTELLGIILLISKYAKKYPRQVQEQGNHQYRQFIIDNFSCYKKTKTIKIFNKLIKKYCFNYDAPIYLFLQLDENLKAITLDDYPFKERLGSDKLVLRLIDSLPEFVNLIKFEEYYKNNEPLYYKFVGEVEEYIKNKKLWQFVKNYVGINSNINYIINLLPYNTGGNYGAMVGNNVYCNLPVRLTPYSKESTFIGSNPATFDSMIVHEFSHPFINPLTDKYIDRISQSAFANISEKMQQLPYNLKQTLINEQVIRALEARYIDLNYGKQEADNFIDKEYKNGFIYIRNINNTLKLYELNRKNHKTIGDYYLNIIESFNIDPDK